MQHILDHLASGWLAALVSAVFVFIASAVLNMFLPWHKGDYRPVPDEDGVRNALRPFAIPPGDYMVPRAASREAMGSPEFAAKINEGPNVMMTVMPTGPMAMAKTFIQWFLFTLFVSWFAGHVTYVAFSHDADRWMVYHTVATVAFASYALALWPMAIWYHRSWGTTIRASVDGLIYAIITAATFGWLWPR